MFQKFFKVKSGADQGEPGSIRYCMENPTAKVVRGDPDFTQWVIDHTPAGLKQRFTSGVINNREELDPTVKYSMLDNFEDLMLGGRDRSSMAMCMIDHEDKEKHETHFIAPIWDLMFGKPVHPYIDRIDRYRFAAWVEWFALSHNLEYTNDKLRTRPAFHQMRLPNEDIIFLRGIWEMVHRWTDNGSVVCREDLQKMFAGTRYQTRFFTKNGDPLEQPEIIGPKGKKLRLTNSIYYRLDYTPAGPKSLDRTDKKAVKSRLEELERIMRVGMQFRAHHLIGRLFGRKEQAKVTRGKARSHLTKLIEAKRTRDNALDVAWSNMRLRDVFLGACTVEYGIPLPHFSPNVRLIGQNMFPNKPEPKSEPKSSDSSDPAALPSKYANSSNLSGMGMSMVDETPIRRRKRKRTPG